MNKETMQYRALQIEKFKREIKNQPNENLMANTNPSARTGYLHENQLDCAIEILYNMHKEEKHWVVLCAPMQSGKSGIFSSLFRLIKKNPIVDTMMAGNNQKGIENVYVMCSVNDNSLIDQIQQDLNAYINLDTYTITNENMIRLGEQKRHTSKDKYKVHVKNKFRQNCLLIVDEAHYGANKENLLHKLFTEVIGVKLTVPYNDYLRDNNIFILTVSATPFAEIASLSEANKIYGPGLDEKGIVRLIPGEGYFGVKDFFNSGKIFNAFNLNEEQGVKDLVSTISKYNGCNGYIIIRTAEEKARGIKKELKKTKLNIRTALEKKGYTVYTVDSSKNADANNINEILINEPNGVEIVLIKNMARLGQRIDGKKNILMVHDINSEHQGTGTVAQSLLGRCCGYKANKNIDIYCNESRAREYSEWEEANMPEDWVPNDNDTFLKKPSDNFPVAFEKVTHIEIPLHSLSETQKKYLINKGEFKERRNKWPLAIELMKLAEKETGKPLIEKLHKELVCGVRTLKGHEHDDINREWVSHELNTREDIECPLDEIYGKYGCRFVIHEPSGILHFSISEAKEKRSGLRKGATTMYN